MPGAWIAAMKYVGPNYNAVFPPGLPEEYRGYVLHPTKEVMDLAAGDDIDCPLMQLDQSVDLSASCTWDPLFDFASIPPSTPVRVPTTDEEKDGFADEVDILDNLITETLAEHYKTHQDLEDDTVVKATNKLEAIILRLRI